MTEIENRGVSDIKKINKSGSFPGHSIEKIKIKNSITILEIIYCILRM